MNIRKKIDIKDSLRISNVIKWFSGFFMFIYFCAVMILSYRTEYFQIANIIFVLFSGFTILYAIINLGIKNSAFYYFASIFLVYATSSYYWAIEKNIVVTRVSTYFNLCLLGIMIINTVETKRELRSAFKGFAIAAALMCLYTFFFYGFDELKIMMIEGERIGAEINESNSFGLICSLGFSVSICYTIFEKSKIHLLISVLLMVSVLMTGSRTAFVGIIFILALAIILNTDSKKIMSTVATVAVIIIAFTWLSQSEYFSVIFERMEFMENLFDKGNNMSMVDNSTETRLNMMKYGWEWFLKNPLLGYGTDQYNILYMQSFGMLRPSHNFHIQMLVEFGIIGFILFEYMFFYLIKKSYSILRYNTESKIVFITVSSLVLIGFGNMYTSEKVFWITLGLCFSYLNAYSNAIKHVEERKIRKRRKGRFKR